MMHRRASADNDQYIRRSLYSEFKRSHAIEKKTVANCALIPASGGIIALVASAWLSTEQMRVVWPMVAVVSIYLVFAYVLKQQIRSSLFGEISFIYLLFAVAYTVFPNVTFLQVDFNFPTTFDGLNFASSSPQPAELGIHGWRHCLFVFGVGLGYLTLRGQRSIPLAPVIKDFKGSGIVIAVMLFFVCASIAAMLAMSSPVEAYIDHYTRFRHLSWVGLRFAYLCVILKGGGYFVVMAFMFVDYRKYRWIVILLVVGAAAFEVIYSLGARIEALIILMAAAGFYHLRVATISVRRGIFYLFILTSIFSAVEMVRSAIGDGMTASEALKMKQEARQAAEFGSVFYTSFHIYKERERGTLPPREWQMFFYEFISLIPFMDHRDYLPQYWYARYYHPAAEVPPQTMGVIADSGIWGGELDLFVRSVINGMLYALLVRWYIKRSDKWWALTIYVYLIATSVMALKYSVFFQLGPLTKVLFPVILIGLFLKSVLTPVGDRKAMVRK